MPGRNKVDYLRRFAGHSSLMEGQYASSQKYLRFIDGVCGRRSRMRCRRQGNRPVERGHGWIELSSSLIRFW